MQIRICVSVFYFCVAFFNRNLSIFLYVLFHFLEKMLQKSTTDLFVVFVVDLVSSTK